MSAILEALDAIEEAKEMVRVRRSVLAGRIKKAIADSGLPLREIAARVGCSHVYLLELGRGSRSPSRGMAEKLVAVLEDEA